MKEKILSEYIDIEDPFPYNIRITLNIVDDYPSVAVEEVLKVRKELTDSERERYK
jgi:hypothetical protein